MDMSGEPASGLGGILKMSLAVSAKARLLRDTMTLPIWPVAMRVASSLRVTSGR